MQLHIWISTEHLSSCSPSDQYGPHQCTMKYKSFSSDCEWVHVFIQAIAVFGNFCAEQSLQVEFRDWLNLSLSAKTTGKK